MRYTVKNYSTARSVKDYIRQYRDAEKFIGYCKECGRYNTCWACPPFDFNTEEYISSYKTAHIIGMKISIDTDVIKENTGWRLCPKISYQMIEEARFGLDKKLLELCTTLKGKFMLTMYPNEQIQQYADRNGWVVHNVDRHVSACKTKHVSDKKNG